jgi:cytochrome P450
MIDNISHATNRKRRFAPGPNGHWLWGSLPDYQQDPVRTCIEAVRQYGETVRFRFGPLHAHLISHPDGVKHILQDNHENYCNGFIRDWYFKPLFGNGLLTSEGEFWSRQRRLIQPAFHRKNLAAFDMITTHYTAEMLNRWETYAESGEPFDVASEMATLTITIAGKALFGTDLAGDAASIKEIVAAAQQHITYRMTHLFAPPEFVPTPRNFRLKRILRRLDAIIHRLIQERRGQPGEREDLLSLLLAARDEETNEGMNDRQLRDETLVLLLAGHETTTYALSWTWYLLAQHPLPARRLRAELAEVLGGRTPVQADLPCLKYTEQVLNEVLRLYPPTWAVSRSSIGPDQLCGYDIPAHSLIIISPYVTQRNPSFWKEPERFDPDRFASGHAEEHHRYSFFPFGGGPRHCIGSGMAMMEAQLIVAMVAQKFELRLVPEHPVIFSPQITLRAKNGILVTCHPVEELHVETSA